MFVSVYAELRGLASRGDVVRCDIPDPKYSTDVSDNKAVEYGMLY